MARETKTILVTGDVVVDHNIYIGQRVGPDSREKLGTRTVKSLGGAGLLHRIVEAMVAAKGDDAEVAFGLKTVGYNTLPPHLHCYAVWAPDAGVWRLTQPLGYGAPADGPASCPVEPTLSVDDPAHIIVLDDGGLGFRSKVSEAAWPKYLRGGRVRKPDWVVLKMSSPVCLGDLWRKIQSKLDGKGQTKLVVVVSVDDLRREEVRVSSRISWERTVTDLINELSRNAALRELRKCAHLIVSFGVEGALHLDNSAPRRPAYRLVFDPENMEGEFGEGSGGLGYLSSLTAGIVGELAGGAKKPDIVRGIRVGLSAMRQALEHGHGEVDETSKDSGPEPGLPLEDMARQSVNPEGGYAVAEVSAPSRAGVLMDYQWSLLCTDPAGEPPMCGRAKRIALVGPKAVGNVPYARFGKLLAVDRNEIESLRILRRLIKDYDKERKTGRPLSIAVFGPPGAGKSFGVKQIAKAMYGDDASILEFNLSQFTKPQELIGLFHQIRDEVLKGVVPVVFWDEFDSKEYLWLQYFLAPMQDGAFQDGQITHPIGKCIFIFAGGTSPTMANFGPPKADAAKWNEFKLRKGPDFCSRLSGYMDVLGPNQRQVLKPKGRGSQWVDDPLDIYFPIRRALLLRAVLGCKENQRLEIDRGVLAAFIEVPKYYHGARSLEKIAVSFRQNNVQSLRRSGLPPAEVMSMHADPDEFMWIVNR
ncbi:ATP-binding protein, partial [bacterium]|nr:ATP-binding protein [bacterium]